jgi:hypothetical protein
MPLTLIARASVLAEQGGVVENAEGEVVGYEFFSGIAKVQGIPVEKLATHSV